MHIDPLMPTLVGALLGILLIGFLLRALKQPHVVGYLLAGMLMGPYGIGLVTDAATMSRLGALGVVLLLFFVGMEVSPARLASRWHVSVIGTCLQVVISVGAVGLLGIWLDWPLERIVLLGFVTSLSSTAVVMKLLQDWGEMTSREGQDVLGILLIQDLIVIPMLIVLGFLGGAKPTFSELSLQIVGGVLLIGLIVWIILQKTIHLPLSRLLRGDHEMQVFAALVICFGLALLSGLFHLSTALGAFAAGMVIGAAKETQWVHQSLEPLRVVFVALFFVSIGMLVDLDFLRTHMMQSGLLVLLVLLTNTVLNAVILRVLGYEWTPSFYAGALLSQIGEFSFVIAAVGSQAHIISEIAYQYTIVVIALSLLVSPLWIRAIQIWLKQPALP